MKIQKSFLKEHEGILYLVPTPIGNLEDMTIRAVRILSEVDAIASEDTRNTLKLLNYFKIKKPQISLHEHNFKERIPQLIAKLECGERLAQVSDAGMPSISDPGYELVVACIEKGIPVISLPGATAGMTALIASGISVQPFLFYGFLPRKKQEQMLVLKQMKELRQTQIFYESPYRIKETISAILKVYGNRQIALCRELTKIHEEYLRGTVLEILEKLKDNPLKGEICLIISGFLGVVREEKNVWENLSIKEHVKVLMQDSGKNSKAAIREVAKIRNLKKSEVYAKFHEI